MKTEKDVEVYKNLTIGNFGIRRLGMKLGLSSTNPYNKYCLTVQTKLEIRKAEFANIIFRKKGRIRHEKAKVCTPSTFSDSEGTRRRGDDRRVSCHIY